MYFINSLHTTLWFKSWETTTSMAYYVSLVGLILFAVLYEGLGLARAQLSAKTHPKSVFTEDGSAVVASR